MVPLIISETRPRYKCESLVPFSVPAAADDDDDDDDDDAIAVIAPPESGRLLLAFAALVDSGTTAAAESSAVAVCKCRERRGRLLFLDGPTPA